MSNFDQPAHGLPFRKLRNAMIRLRMARGLCIVVCCTAPTAVHAAPGRSCASETTYQGLLSSITRTAEVAGGNHDSLQTFFSRNHAKFSDTTLDSVDHSTGKLTCSTTLQFDSVLLPRDYSADFSPVAVTYIVQARADGGAGAIVRLQGPPQLVTQIAGASNSISLYKQALQPRPGQAVQPAKCGDGTSSCKWASPAEQAAAGYKPEALDKSPGDVEWRTVPNADDLGGLYPEIASRQGRTGDTVVSCTILSDLRPGNCNIITENPPGFGFGLAATRVARLYQAQNPGDIGRTVTLNQHWAMFRPS